MTASPSEPFIAPDGNRYYSRRSWLCAEQTRRRARRAKLDAEVDRLRRLGVDPEWLERVAQHG